MEVVVNIMDRFKGQEEYAFTLITLISHLRTFLEERQCSHTEILRVQKCWIAEPNGTNHTTKRSLLLLEDVKHLGFKDVTQQFSEGFDYEHSVLVISALARFHAASYCFRKSTRFNWNKKYPSILTEIVVPKLSTETATMLEKIFKEHTDYSKYAVLFMGLVRGEMEMMNKKLESFGVLSHGNLTKQNMIFKYKSAVDSKQFCSDVVFQDPYSFHYGSCVLDLLQLILTSIDPHVRRCFMPDFVCSVYYDSFVKTVGSIDNNIPVFSKTSFIAEFDQNIMYGFLFSTKFHSNIHKHSGKEDSVPAYKKNIMRIMRDVIQFKLNTTATLKLEANLK